MRRMWTWLLWFGVTEMLHNRQNWMQGSSYSFPFQFTFPPECPPTFNATHGSMKYSLWGFLSSQVNQYKIEALITVGSVVDLNLHPNVLEPVDLISRKDVKKFCCLSAGYFNNVFILTSIAQSHCIQDGNQYLDLATCTDVKFPKHWYLTFGRLTWLVNIIFHIWDFWVCQCPKINIMYTVSDCIEYAYMYKSS